MWGKISPEIRISAAGTDTVNFADLLQAKDGGLLSVRMGGHKQNGVSQCWFSHLNHQ